MKLLAKMRGVKPLNYSHAEFLLWNEGDQQLYTIGARKSGTEISKVQNYYGKHDVLILKPKKSLTDDENISLWRYFKDVDASKYQYGNFLAWIMFLKTLVWYTKKGDKRTYCYELAARFANVVNRWTDGASLDQVSIYDLYDNHYYTVK